MPYYEYNGGNQGGFLSNMPAGVKNILLVNVLAFVALLVNEHKVIELFALFVPTSPFFKIWQPITYMFIHGGAWHILFNMYSLVMFGMVLENVLGTKKFVSFYFVAGIGAALTHIAVQYILFSTGALSEYRLLATPTVGASGSIYGILIAYGMLFPDSRLTLIFPPVTLKAKVFVWIFIGIELFTGITGTMDGVAHFAHLGGMLFGWALLMYWRKTGKLWRH